MTDSKDTFLKEDPLRRTLEVRAKAKMGCFGEVHGDRLMRPGLTAVAV